MAEEMGTCPHIHTKVQQPGLPACLFRRRGLLDLLHSGLDRNLPVLSAQSGSGKTPLAGQRYGYQGSICTGIEKAKDLLMKKSNADRGAQAVYFSHGGGPLPLLGDTGHQAMVEFMTRLPAQLTRPDAIVVVSAHWEERATTLLGAPKPPMFYDYYGFPKEAYSITYPAPGHPALAERIAELLEKNDIPARIDTRRGFDHGLFIPLTLMYPRADIPAIQLSLLRGLDPAAHVAVGKALRELLSEKILIIGSGFSFHNLNAFFGQTAGAPDTANDAFQDWLIETCAGPLSQPERERRLIEWERAPSARYCHPREEHLLPLHVCLGMTGRPAAVSFDDRILGKRAVAFLWR